MRLIIFTVLFLIPLIGFASFPIQMSIPCDTIIESKKETMEEYKIRIQKQLKLTIETKNETVEDSSFKFKKKRFLQNWNWKNALTIVILLFFVVILIDEYWWYNFE